MNWKELKGKVKSIPFIGGMYNALYGNRKVQRIYDSKVKLLKENGYDLAERIEDILSSQNVSYYMDFGSLLGITRSKQFIGHDTDIDYSIFISDQFGWEDLERVLTEGGLKKANQCMIKGVITEQTYTFDGISVDFFGHFDDDDNSIVYICYAKKGKKYSSIYDRDVAELKMFKVCKTKKISVNGKMYTVPEDAEKYLESIYTANWRTPDPNWISEKGPAWIERKDLSALRKAF